MADAPEPTKTNSVTAKEIDNPRPSPNRNKAWNKIPKPQCPKQPASKQRHGNPPGRPLNNRWSSCHECQRCLTSKLRHSHRRLSLAAIMMFKFHGSVKTERAVAVACSAIVRCHGCDTGSILWKNLRAFISPRLWWTQEMAGLSLLLPPLLKVAANKPHVQQHRDHQETNGGNT